MQPERSEEYTMGYLVGKVESMESSLAELRSLVTRGLYYWFLHFRLR